MILQIDLLYDNSSYQNIDIKNIEPIYWTLSSQIPIYTTYLYGLFVHSQVFSCMCYLYLEKEKATKTFKIFSTSIAIASLKMELKDVINTGTILLLLVKIDLNNDSANYLDMIYIECDSCDPSERNNTTLYLVPWW